MTTSTDTIRITVLDPMQRIWHPPEGRTKTDLDFLILDLANWCKGYSPDQLSRAYLWLRENYTYRAWPSIALWKKAVNATAPNVRPPDMPKKDMPWDIRNRLVARTFDHGYAKSELAVEMRKLLLFNEYRGMMLQIIRENIQKGGNGYDLEMKPEYLAWLREKGKTYQEAAAYRETDAYRKVHGEPYDFAAMYRNVRKGSRR